MKQCRTCGVTKRENLFYHQIRGTRKHFRGSCKECQNRAYNAKYRGTRTPHQDYQDVVYDYKFYRFFGRTHHEALAWLLRGYPNVDEFSINHWQLRQYENDHWEVDVLV